MYWKTLGFWDQCTIIFRLLSYGCIYWANKDILLYIIRTCCPACAVYCGQETLYEYMITGASKRVPTHALFDARGRSRSALVSTFPVLARSNFKAHGSPPFLYFRRPKSIADLGKSNPTGHLTPEEAKWVYIDWTEQEKAVLGHDFGSFADDLDPPPGHDCAAETASECLFPQHPPVTIDGNCQRAGCDRYQSGRRIK